MTSKNQPPARARLEDDEIRILDYDPAESLASGVTTCRTKISRLADIREGRAPPYAALSYVWGDKVVTRPLTCDSTVIHVRANLEQALSTIWKAHPSRRLWADAICITQDDVVERSHQVSLMGDIFQSANRVLVSLGPVLLGENRFWELLESYIARGDFDDPDFEDELDDFMEGTSNNLTLGLNDLVRRPWFQRAWVRNHLIMTLMSPMTHSLTSHAGTSRLTRKFVSHQRLTLFCGDRVMPWDGFVDALNAFNQKGAFLSLFTPLRNFLRDQSAMFGISVPLQARSNVQDAQSTQSGHGASELSLLSLLVYVWSREASDPRDKIYAFTSRRLSSSSYPQLRPDYSLNVRCTFIRFIRNYINCENNLDFLKFAKAIGHRLPGADPRTLPVVDGGVWVRVPNVLREPRPPPRPETAYSTATVDTHINLPSWVCDWRKHAQRPHISDHPGQKEEHYFDVRAASPPLPQSIHDFSNQLVLRGCALARVARHDSQSMGAFLSLPVCAVKKTMNGNIPRQSQLSDGLAFKSPLPKTSMNILLLQTLLHDETYCKCNNTDNRSMVAPIMVLIDDPECLTAHCQHPMYPRSRVCSLDWVFMLDGHAEPVILRPHTMANLASGKRGEMGFSFISVCPLVVGIEREIWRAAPFVYGEISIF